MTYESSLHGTVITVSGTSLCAAMPLMMVAVCTAAETFGNTKYLTSEFHQYPVHILKPFFSLQV